jgi:F1F0 ATPase subunit 2
MAIFCLTGFALGALHFVGLRFNTALYLAPDRRALAFGLHTARMALVVAALVLVARIGAVPLVAAFVGFLASRYAVATRVRRTA